MRIGWLGERSEARRAPTEAHLAPDSQQRPRQGEARRASAERKILTATAMVDAEGIGRQVLQRRDELAQSRRCA